MAAVVDANVFMRGRANLEFDQYYTVPSVVEELESSDARISFDTEEVEVVKPSEEKLERVWEKSDKISSPTSDADEELLALALDRDDVLVTDDKALQNLALHLELDFRSYMGEEIDDKRVWKVFCENCGSKISGKRCSKCGSTRIRRKQVQYSSE